jgi:hypothetical protein
LTVTHISPIFAIELPAASDKRAAALAIFGFIAGYSEPFAVGIVNKVAAMEPPTAPGKDEPERASKT